MVIYKFENKINGKIYIGQTVNLENRIKDHSKWTGDSLISKAIKKYGLCSFDVCVVDSTDDKSTLNKKEIHWINFYDCKVPNGYNLKDGGTGGDTSKFHTYKKLTPEEKQNISVKTKEAMANLSLEKKEKMKSQLGKTGELSSNYGRKATEAQLKTLSDSHLGKPGVNKGKKFPYKKRSPRLDMMGENNPAKRPDVREKISKKLKGRVLSVGNKGKTFPYKPRPNAKGRVVWNKGLTKETDTRVLQISETEKKTKAKRGVDLCM